jgi:hypothetical protein
MVLTNLNFGVVILDFILYSLSNNQNKKQHDSHYIILGLSNLHKIDEPSGICIFIMRTMD